MGFIEKMHLLVLDGEIVEVALAAYDRNAHDRFLSSMLAGPPCHLAGWRRDR